MKLLIEVDCGEKYCENCERFGLPMVHIGQVCVEATCLLYNRRLHGKGIFRRIPECLAAQKAAESVHTHEPSTQHGRNNKGE